MPYVDNEDDLKDRDCPICLRAPRHPDQCHNRHRFCRPCIDRWVAAKTNDPDSFELTFVLRAANGNREDYEVMVEWQELRDELYRLQSATNDVGRSAAKYDRLLRRQSRRERIIDFLAGSSRRKAAVALQLISGVVERTREACDGVVAGAELLHDRLRRMRRAARHVAGSSDGAAQEFHGHVGEATERTSCILEIVGRLSAKQDAVELLLDELGDESDAAVDESPQTDVASRLDELSVRLNKVKSKSRRVDSQTAAVSTMIFQAFRKLIDIRNDLFATRRFPLAASSAADSGPDLMLLRRKSTACASCPICRHFGPFEPCRGD